ncbi:hypothetical protein [Chryseolinea lacunae]|uniref:Transporter n=1 Tax=Chryseolinea lacunae TaxID=2801331 RepID=A0ABS1KWW0_9BACT|nr:hypothetical protein [Chryseolinea lacunae]MBL0743951.1 hypothetical protein [Chryseolinea lacunae]
MFRFFCRSFLLLILFAFHSHTTRAQGCSDAGFCTMGAMKPDQPFNKKIALKLRSMEISFYRGTTTLTPVIYVATADLNFGLNAKTSFQVKLPYQMARGQLGNTSSLGDISLCLTRNIRSTEKYDINFSFGGKLPSNNSNKHDAEGNALPMYYQTSLGTYDLIAGVSLISRNWMFATGVQLPLNRNGNQFLWTEWKDQDELDYVQKYANSKELKRGADVMLRIERNFRFSRLNFTVGLLPIFRVYHDEITDKTGERVRPDGAMGLALSGTFTTGYSFNVRSGVKLLLAHKIRNREFNPDGLTREFVSTLGYYYRF